MPFIKINETNTYYELHGDGAPLILIAGYCCDHCFWDLIINQLTPHFQTLIFDNWAVGQTKAPEGALDLELMAQDLMILSDKLGLEKPHLVGHSMGGMIAQIMARKYPERLGQLILMNTTPVLNARAVLAMKSLLALRVQNIPIKQLIDAALPYFFSSHFLEQQHNIQNFTDCLLNNPFPQSSEDQERQLNALIQFDSRSWLKDINKTTHILASEEDIVSPVAESQLLAAHIPKATLNIIAGAHSNPLEQALAVADFIVASLGRAL